MRIANHPTEKPLYLNIAPQHVHDPYGDGTERTMGERRRMYELLVREVDEMVGQVVRSLKEHGMWNDTMMLIHTDNGGELLFEDTCSELRGSTANKDVGVGFKGGAADNGPLRGGKFTLWQGGIRGVGLLAGGKLPVASQGTTFDGLIHVVDLWGKCSLKNHKRLSPFL